MTTANDTALNRIRALLAKAEGAATQEEADAYNEKAMDLMGRYGVEQAALDHNRGDDTVTDRTFDIPNPYANIKANLMACLADNMRCRALIFTNRHGGTRTVHVFGHAHDIDRVDLLNTSLLLQMSGGVARVRAPRGSTRSWRISWMRGFTARIVQRVKELEHDAAEDATGATPGTALVLADRSARAQAACDAVYPNPKNPSKKTVQARAFDAGFAAADNADLGQTRVGGSRQALSR